MKQKATKLKPIYFRPSEYDMAIIERVHALNPHLTSMTDVVRAILRYAELYIEKEVIDESRH